jgi:hypothetical protein
MGAKGAWQAYFVTWEAHSAQIQKILLATSTVSDYATPSSKEPGISSGL